MGLGSQCRPLDETVFAQLILSKTDPKKRLQKSLGVYEVTEKSYVCKTKKFQCFFGKIDIFCQNGPFFLFQTAFKQLNPSKTDPIKRLQKTLGLYKVTEKSYTRKTKEFQLFFSEKLTFLAKMAIFSP